MAVLAVIAVAAALGMAGLAAAAFMAAVAVRLVLVFVIVMMVVVTATATAVVGAVATGDFNAGRGTHRDRGGAEKMKKNGFHSAISPKDGEMRKFNSRRSLAFAPKTDALLIMQIALFSRLP
ncbi:MAG TPA: hypothetical protein VGH65_08635 [Verrucomicrobiaceae bacterium]|jgi:hypothetical protein